MRQLPSGTVTLLFTDIEGSTRLLQQLGRERYVRALEAHRRLLRAAFAGFGGVEVEMQGDSFHFAFASARAAVAAAAAGQRALAEHAWEEEPIRVRIGLHSGEPLESEGLYAGLDVHRAARVMSAAHGGQVLLSAATYDFVRGELSDGLSIRDLGEHRLKDLIEPERLYQLGGGDFPPPQTLTGRATNLPAQPGRLIARERELATLLQRLHDGARLVTVTGAGGIGKTRIALAAAAELLDEFPAGVWAVFLAPLAEPAALLPAIAQTVGVAEAANEPLEQTLARELREQELLVVLDNFEHLVAAASMVSRLLGATERLRVLVTSREPLRVSGESVLDLPPLATPPTASVGAAEALAQGAVELFVERAIAATGEFRLTDENAGAVAAICARLDGLPLAIELAAARSRILSPPALLARLQSRLPLLTRGPRELPARQQTLRATIDWSYDLLDEGERRLFSRLSVFSSGWTLEAAEQVCDTALDTLASLADKSLARNEAGRFSMLETIREYALERLEERDEAGDVRRRHAAYFLDLVERADAGLKGADQRRWLDVLAAEHDNLRAALSFAIEHDPGIALRLAAVLSWFWFVHGHLREGRLWLEGVLARAPSADPRVRERALSGLGTLCMQQGELDLAAAHYGECLELRRALEDRPGIVAMISNLGVVAQFRGDFAYAERLFAETLDLARELDDPLAVTTALGNLGSVAIHKREFDRAREFLEQSLPLARELRDDNILQIVLQNFGTVAHEQGEHRRATELLCEALVVARDLHDAPGVIANLGELAVVAAATGDSLRAARLLGAEEELRASIETPVQPADAARHERTESAVRTALGAAAYEAAFTEGGAMTPEEAIALALREYESE